MDGFADAVRATARMRQAVSAGLVGAVAACTVAFGAMAAESTYVGARAEMASTEAGTGGFLQARNDLGRQNAEFFLNGLGAIAQADLGGLSPRESVLTLKAMARRVLKDGPYKVIGDEFDADPTIPGAKAVEKMTTFLSRLADQPVITAGVVQSDAGSISRQARAMLGAEGLTPKPTPFEFEGVSAEAQRRASAKADVLKTIVAKASDPDADIVDLVFLAQEGEFERAPAQRVLIDRLAANSLSDESLPARERVELARDVATAQAADGAFAAINRLWQEDEQGLDKRTVAKAAEVALSTVDVIAKASEPKADAPAPGR